jgi:hypothetical protein
MTKQAAATRLKPIGALKASQAAEKLAFMGEPDVARDIQRAMKLGNINPQFSALIWPFPKKPIPAYKYTDHAFGFFGRASSGGTATVDIKDAGNITADATLKGATIKITLDRLRVYQYPGEGIHTILFDFYAQHQAPGDMQDLHFTQKYRAQEGSGAGIEGYPVFVGLKVGNEGVSFKCFTVNIKNDDDQRVLGFLGSDVFKKGLQLINSVNPAVPIVSGFATGIVDAFAHRNDNVPVQDFYMGLDFSGIQTRAQLQEGSYIAVQVPDIAAWDWSLWVFKPANGQVVSKAAPSKGVPFNYVLFSVSKV